jgi:hypothetical protein
VQSGVVAESRLAPIVFDPMSSGPASGGVLRPFAWRDEGRRAAIAIQ